MGVGRGSVRSSWDDARAGCAKRSSGVCGKTAREVKRPINSSEYSDGDDGVARVDLVTASSTKDRLVTHSQSHALGSPSKRPGVGWDVRLTFDRCY